MFWRDLQRWRGVALVALASVAIGIFAASGQLVLYIHPRYIVFTIAMVVVALVLVAASVLLARREEDDEESRGRVARVLSAIGLGIAAVLAVAMVVLPPATLSSVTAGQRDLNGSALGSSGAQLDEAAAAPSAAFASFTVLDWASLLRQTSDLEFYRDKPVDVVGFITPDVNDPENVFYVSRFFVTCCAVDAQPAGVPVYVPGWTATLSADDWVRVTGEFGPNPSSASTDPLAVIPESVEPTEQPREPYLF